MSLFRLIDGAHTPDRQEKHLLDQTIVALGIVFDRVAHGYMLFAQLLSQNPVAMTTVDAFDC